MPRIERRTIENVVRVIGWADDDGELVSDVTDRFQSRYVFVVERTGERCVSDFTLARKGFTSLPIRDAVALGFSTEEFLELLQWEKTSSSNIQSEDELNELLARAVASPCF
ncbi:hypothetical protein DTW90_21980 [Neorhizobium sp. P12A]|uniref:hypothetical protein n=1 Tax=Neorhizobium sp. P12A TaxID=2268027 RepID=UPI0011EE7846|nr:hypothetical protein [Neorhizobium sp. P12A]KAA0695648.1 hypothetical protein DTW90_21980 [Neorhizobium sp. P12A]